MCLDYRGTASAAIVSYVSTSIVNPVSLGVYNSHHKNSLWDEIYTIGF